MTLRTRLVRLAVALTLMSPAVGAAQQGIPTPESHFGFSVGAEKKLFTYDESISYFRRLAGVSAYVQLVDVGTTSWGRPWTAVVISSPENLRNLPRIQQINQRLAHPAGLTDSAAKALAREGRVIVDISGGLHASEIAGSQHTPELAWELLSKLDDPDHRAILDQVVFFLWPSINPDGQDIVVENCRARDAGNAAPMELYQRYIGHDNNRDAYMLNVIESRVVHRVWREWEPSIIYVHHQSSPEPTRIWLPPFADPVGRRAPPIPARTVNTIGMAIAQELDARGQPGAVHALSTFDAWYPGYIDYMGIYQHIATWWTETQGGSCANTKAALSSNPDNFPAYRSLEPRTLYLSPWEGGPWRLRDAVDYMVTASMATLKYAARYKDDLLYNRYVSGRNVIRKYQSGAPYAYVVPQTQRDPMAPVELLRRLAFQGVRVAQADAPIQVDGVTYPAGTWVIPMDQEYAELVRTLLEVQVYPSLGDDTPYDAAGWTLPFQMGIQVHAAQAPLDSATRARLPWVRGTATDWRTTPGEPLTTNAVAAGIVPAPGAITGRGAAVALDPAQNNTFRFLQQARRLGGTVQVTPPTDTARRYLVTGLPTARADSLAAALMLQAQRRNLPNGAVPAPMRLALYKAAPGNMDQGWTEWLFDTYQHDYTLIGPADLAAGDLSARFDVIVFGSQGVGGGGRGGRGGVAVAASPTTEAVGAFVRSGGTVIFWGSAASSAITAWQLPVRNVLQGVGRNAFFSGISILEVDVTTSHPVMSGMPARADVVLNSGPVFQTTAGFSGEILARYPADTSALRSGFLRGDSLIRGMAAAVDVALGDGHVLLFGFQPQWRGQPIGTFRTLFNGVLYARRTAVPRLGAATQD